MIFREAHLKDIAGMQVIRHAVRENQLSDQGLVTYDDYTNFLKFRGKGWICESDGRIAGFAIVDLTGRNVWALFVDPEHEGKGAARKLHAMMLEWYFMQTHDVIWLSTAPGTRAEAFYRKAGWRETGLYGKEVRFEMGYEDFFLSFKHTKSS